MSADSGTPVAGRDGAERELREAARVVAHLRGVSFDEATQALEAHAELTGTMVVEVAREVLAHRPVIRPRRLPAVTSERQRIANDN